MSLVDVGDSSVSPDPAVVVQLLGRRRRQEDAVAVRRGDQRSGPAFLVALADGHGKHGQEAAQIAVAACVELWDDGCWQGRSFAVLAGKLFRDIHQRISSQHPRSGACLTVVLATPGTLRAAWAGNAEAWVGVDQLACFARPHDPYRHLSEADRIASAGGAFWPCPPERCQSGSHPCRQGHGYVVLQDRSLSLEVSRAVGHAEKEPIIIPDPEIAEHPIVSGTRLLVASDGAWGVLRSQMGLVSATLAHLLPEHAAGMVHESLKSDASDNATAVIVDLDDFRGV